MSMVAQFTSEYLDQLDVNPNNLVEVSMVRDLVDQEVQYLRKTKILAKEHFIQEDIDYQYEEFKTRVQHLYDMQAHDEAKAVMNKHPVYTERWVKESA